MVRASIFPQIDLMHRESRTGQTVQKCKNLVERKVELSGRKRGKEGCIAWSRGLVWEGWVTIEVFLDSVMLDRRSNLLIWVGIPINHTTRSRQLHKGHIYREVCVLKPFKERWKRIPCVEDLSC